MEGIKGAASQIINGGIEGTAKKGEAGSGFSTALKDAIGDANKVQVEADKAINAFTEGELSIHDTMIAVEKANLSFQMMLQVRNKLISAYEEVMRTQV
ncbi:MAG: flagellar hook-basal body complex protein FliE [Thermodesulfobacteriota bacterium]